MIVLGLVGIAAALRFWIAPHITHWLRAREGWPKWQIRATINIRNRLQLIFFVILTWGTYAVMQEITWPSRSYLLSIVATLAVTLTRAEQDRHQQDCPA